MLTLIKDEHLALHSMFDAKEEIRQGINNAANCSYKHAEVHQTKET